MVNDKVHEKYEKYEKHEKHEKKASKINNNAGTSMAEVLVAFVIVMLMLAVFNQCINIAVNMWHKSTDIIKAQQEFSETYAKKDDTVLEKNEEKHKITLCYDLEEITLKNVRLYKYNIKDDGTNIHSPELKKISIKCFKIQE